MERNSACVMTGRVGAISEKYALTSFSTTSRSMRISTGFCNGGAVSPAVGSNTWMSPSPLCDTSHV